ncbi:MAG: glycerophosphodiester phosphodiesterase family protein [Emcibacteraceae bacterium]|nr:glycerophosphodiester phosphodiesterase family protein [Emcibacteraceae bacterium]MDG1858214.1 glycerophosphodiester phosphodiesterase family protein [Emcibacteraceae bacterium]
MPKWLTKQPFAHRGLHSPRNNIVENSLSAFQSAISNGFGFELDVLLSKDNKAIVFHDVSMKRLTNQNDAIIDLNASELEKIVLNGTKDHIPTLETVLHHFQGVAPILIEIKGDQGLLDVISEAVNNEIKDYSGEVAVMSFYPEITKHFKSNYPEILCGLVATRKNDEKLHSECYKTDFQIDTLNSQNLDFIAYDIKSLPNDTSRFCIRENIPVLTWTVKSEEDKNYAKKHANNIIFEL